MKVSDGIKVLYKQPVDFSVRKGTGKIDNHQDKLENNPFVRKPQPDGTQQKPDPMERRRGGSRRSVDPNDPFAGRR
jgi:hypothetical protein